MLQRSHNSVTYYRDLRVTILERSSLMAASSKKISITAGLISLGFAAAMGLAGTASADWSPQGPNKFEPTMPDVFPDFHQPPFAATSGPQHTEVSSQGTLDDDGYQAADVRGPAVVAVPQT
jgi:hypothetical protein